MRATVPWAAWAAAAFVASAVTGKPASQPSGAPAVTTRPAADVQAEGRKQYEEGLRLLELRDYPAALRKLRAALESAPSAPWAESAREAIRKTERQVRGLQARRFFERGKALLRRGEYKAAILSLKASIRLQPKGPRADTAREDLRGLEQAGRDRLVLARDLLSKKRYLLAHRELKAVAEEFAGLAVADEAAREANLLEQRPEFIQARRRDTAARFLEKAALLEKQGRLFLAWKNYTRVVETYPGTPAAEAAARRLHEIRSDPDLADSVDRQRAEFQTTEWFTLAENYRTNAERLAGPARTRFLARARALYSRIVSTYPRTPLAEKARAARARLENLTTRPGTAPAP